MNYEFMISILSAILLQLGVIALHRSWLAYFIDLSAQKFSVVLTLVWCCIYVWLASATGIWY